VDELRILIVSDDPLARAGLAGLLQEQEGCAVVGQVAADADLARAAAQAEADVVAWDLGSTPEGWGDQAHELRENHLPLVVLLADEGHAATAVAAGARGVLLRNADAAALAAALQAAARGLVVIDPALATTLLPARDRGVPAPVEDLTSREHSVLQLLADGLSNKAIAERLGISEHTVKFHVNAIMSKLDAQSRTEAVTRAARLGLIIL